MRIAENAKGVGHRGHAVHFGDAADVHHIGLDYIHCPAADIVLEFVAGTQVFAAGYGHR